MFYYLSIGSNLSPLENFSRVIAWLAETFECITVFPVIETEPEHLSSEKTFFNTLAIIYSEKEKVIIKQQFNQLEEQLGRNRSDPMRSFKDRPADLDILESANDFQLEIFEKYTECYIKNVYSLKKTAVKLPVGDLFLGDRPSTVYFDCTTGQIRIINDELYGLDNWVKSRFKTE